ncbi:MAG: uroporphyrinogen-III C-methyltransferase [Bacteroidota bacterium]
MLQLQKTHSGPQSRSSARAIGVVHLVGAGPGDPDLISVKGARLLQQADALVYDRLVHPALVEETPARAEKIYVGKAASHKSMPQDAINALLVNLAKKYRTVVRLKGGDPFVYGRGGEEAQALRTAAVPFTVVPGISSATSVPAHAGIPVTHRGLAQSFTVVTGHTALHASDIDWSTYVSADTLVVLMGLGKLPAIAEKLMAYGKPASTPAAVISQGSTAAQQTVTGNLADIAVRASALPTPAIVVVGEVVTLHDEIAWFHPNQTASENPPVFTEHIYAVSA